MDPLYQSVGIREKCLSNGIQFQGFSTLGKQWTKHYGHEENPVLSHPKLVEIANKYKVDVAQVVINWATRHGISVIPASTKTDRQQTNFDSYAKFDLTTEEMEQIDKLDGELRPVVSPVNVHFENPREDGGDIDAYWVSEGHGNQEDEEHHLGPIPSGRYMTMQSYHGHKFVFRDPYDGNKIVSQFRVHAPHGSTEEEFTHVIGDAGEL